MTLWFMGMALSFTGRSLVLVHGSVVLVHGFLGGHGMDRSLGETDRRSGQNEASNCGDSSHESVLINIIISFFNQICQYQARC
jgi:hypothetical protein